jgi:methionyl-tRNA formyltransferase
MKKNKAVFIGTGKFALPIFEAVINCPFLNLEYLITSPDKPIGRKKELTSSPVKQLALDKKIKILQPKKISEIKSKLSEIDLAILAAYGQIIPKDIIDIPKFGFINLHPSLLPKYRGPSPIQSAILNGDKITGISIMLMDEKMDHGPIISQKEIKISNNDTFQSLEEKLSDLAGNFLIEILPQYLEGKIKPESQDESKVSYTKILTRQDGKIDWQKSASEIERKIRAFYPWPGTWTILNGKRIKIIKAVEKETKLSIKTGKGYLLPELVQPEGKKPMKWQEYLKGNKLCLSQ